MAFPPWFQKLVSLGKLTKKAQLKEQKSLKIRSKRVAPRVQTNEANISSMSTEQRLLKGSLKEETLREYTRGLYSIDGDMTTMFTSAIQDRRDYLETASELRRYPIAARILKILSAEIAKPNDKGEILDLVSDDEEVDKELKLFMEQHNLDNLLRMVIPDILNLGEYTFAIEIEEGKGITAISDTVDQLAVIAFYERGVPSNYLVWKTNDYYIEPPNRYCHFVIGEEKMRVAVNDSLHRGYQIDFDKLSPELKAKIPEFVRVGEPIFFSVVEKIRQLQILDQIVIATKLSAITQTKLISLQVPASMPVDKVMEACQKFEETLNTQTGVDTDAELVTVAEIMGKAGRYTVIPNYTDEKGSLAPLDIRNDPQVDDILHSIEDFRQVLLSCVGIPYKLVFGPRGNETEGSRGDDVRIHAMFSNMISSIQSSIRNGITQLVLMHLLNKGFKVKAKDFEVIFKNASVNVGDLEKLEYDDAKQELVGRKIDFIQKLLENPEIAAELNKEGVLDWIGDSIQELSNGIPIFKRHIEDAPLQGRSLSRSAEKRKREFVNKVTDTFKKLRQDRENGSDDNRSQEVKDLLDPNKIDLEPEPELDKVPEEPVDGPDTQNTLDSTKNTLKSPQKITDFQARKKQTVDKVTDTFKKKRQERLTKEQEGKDSLSEDLEDLVDNDIDSNGD